MRTHEYETASQEKGIMVRTIKLVVSDLHVGSGDPFLDCFGQRQQSAWEGLLAAASGNSGSPLGDVDDVELIINGDGFDFQIVAPYGTGGVIDASQAVEKLRNIVSAHHATHAYRLCA